MQKIKSSVSVKAATLPESKLDVMNRSQNAMIGNTSAEY